MNDTNKQPAEDPTEEEIFDYFLGRAVPELSRHVSAYLKAHPRKERELREWASLESRFANLPVQDPSPLVLNRVRNMAREQMSHTSTGWFSAVKARFSAREWALVCTLVVAVVVSHVMRQPPGGETTASAPSKASQAAADTALVASRVEPVIEDPALSGTMTPADEIIQALTDYDAAVELYQAGSFQEANRGFAAIVSKRPNFEKRRELYSYWVESLKKLGKYALAEKKQQVLEDILAEESGSH